MSPPIARESTAFAVSPWLRARELLRGEVGERNYAAWIAPLECTWSDGRVAIVAGSPGTRDRVERHFLPAIEAAVEAVAGRPCRVIVSVAPGPGTVLGCGSPPSEHTFETFVVGDSNREAYEAARGLARGSHVAPLFLCGPTGVGKTHLVHAVHQALAARGVGAASLPAAELMEALLAAYRSDRHERFWQDLDGLGALLLDDIHSLAGHEQFQEHLGVGLAAWVVRGGMLVLASDRPPDAVPALAGRWRNWFGDACITRIEPPEPALRTAILSLKARALGLVLSDTLAARIAAHVTGSVRLLEGALTRLLARVHLSGRPLDDALALEALPELRVAPPAPPTVERVAEATAAAFGIPLRLIFGRNHRLDVRVPRQVAMFLAQRLARLPTVHVARVFGRDRGTITHAARAIASRVSSDLQLATLVDRIEQHLLSGVPLARARRR